MFLVRKSDKIYVKGLTVKWFHKTQKICLVIDEWCVTEKNDVAEKN